MNFRIKRLDQQIKEKQLRRLQLKNEEKELKLKERRKQLR